MGDDDLAHVCFLPSGQHLDHNKIFTIIIMVKQNNNSQTKNTRSKNSQNNNKQNNNTQNKSTQKKTPNRRPQAFTPCSPGDAREWCRNDNVNNYINMWERCTPMPLNYKLINLYLLTLHYPSSKNITNKYVAMVNEYKEYAPNRNNVINLERHIIDSIKRLYLMIKSMPRMINHVRNKKSSAMIYHGSMLPHLKDLKVGDEYRTPIFMSTSLIRDVAVRFARVNRTSADTAVVLRIEIPSEMLKDFQYMYFGGFCNLGNCNSIKETEVLLNLDSVLRLERINEPMTVNYKVYGCKGRSLRNAQKNITFFDFTFMNHSRKNVNRLLNISVPKN